MFNEKSSNCVMVVILNKKAPDLNNESGAFVIMEDYNQLLSHAEFECTV